MSYRPERFSPGHVYHVYNRGVNKQDIFADDRDRQRLLTLLPYCLTAETATSYSLFKRSRQQSKQKRRLKPAAGKGLVDLLCYCFMDNHFHLLLKENMEQGLSKYMQKLLNSYARYFNTRHQRSGPFFSGRFRSTLVNSDEHFLHVSRYVHLNPFAARLVDNPFNYQWSSVREYTSASTKQETVCHTSLIKSMMTPKQYRDFTTDYAGYSRDLEDIKHLLLE